jgi:DNA polymerase III gamma/tau subunit
MHEDNHELLEVIKQVLERTEETKECVQRLDKKVDLHIQKTEIELSQIAELDNKQNALLEEHSKRSDRLERDNILREEGLRKEFEDRFQDIEKPREWIITTGKVLVWIASAAGALYGAYEFIRAFILK